MNDLALIKQTVVQLLALATGLTNNRFQTNAGGRLPEISGTYCNVATVNNRIHGKPSVYYTDGEEENTLNENVRAASIFTLSLNFYRNGANQYAENLKGAMYKSAVKAFLYQSPVGPIGWFGVSDVRDLTSAFSGQSEERAQCDITLAIDGVTTEVINQALSVEVNIEDGDNPEQPVFYAQENQDGGDFLAL